MPLVVQALRNHAGASVRTLTAVCRALANLAASSQCQREEALGVLTGILRQEGQPVFFYEEACRALWLLGNTMAERLGSTSGGCAAAGSGAAAAAAAALSHLSVCAFARAAACALYASGLLVPGAEDQVFCTAITFSLTINYNSSAPLPVCLPAECTVGELRSLLCYQLSSSRTVLPIEIELTLGEFGRELEDERTLGSYNLNGEGVHRRYRRRHGGGG